jgi:hypothetical protein
VLSARSAEQVDRHSIRGAGRRREFRVCKAGHPPPPPPPAPAGWR